MARMMEQSGLWLAAAVLAAGCTPTDSKPDTNNPSKDDTEQVDTSDTTETPVWADHRIETSSTLNGVYVAGSAIFVVGTGGKMWRYTSDVGWSAISVEVEDEDLNAIWGTADGSGFLACGNGGFVVDYNGSTVNVEDLGTSAFLDIYGTSRNDIYTVGWGGPYHFNGTEWNREVLPGSEQINAIFTTASTVFAVGQEGAIDMRLAGVWSSIESPTDKDLYAVHGTADNDVWAVGEEGTVLHWDGTLWTLLTDITSQTLWGVWEADADHVFVVGNNGTAMLFDGTAWKSIPTGVTNNLYAVSGSSLSTVWATGNRGAALLYAP